MLSHNIKAQVLLKAFSSVSGEKPVVVECGGMRFDREIPSDGASTMHLARWINQSGGCFYSIDNNPDVTANCAKILKGEETLTPLVHLHTGDGAKFIEGYSGTIDMLYLDSSGDPTDTYNQLVAALPKLKMTSVIVIDDLHNHEAGSHWGKGEWAVPVLRQQGWSQYEVSANGGGRIGLFFHEDSNG